MFTRGLNEFKEVNKKSNSFIDEALLKNKRTIVQYIIAILLRSTLLDNKEKNRLEMHYGFNQEDITKEIESFFTNENDQSNSTSERLLYPDLSSVSERLIREAAEKQISNAATANEQLINEKIQANNKFNNDINIIKDIRNYYETETIIFIIRN